MQPARGYNEAVLRGWALPPVDAAAASEAPPSIIDCPSDSRAIQQIWEELEGTLMSAVAVMDPARSSPRTSRATFKQPAPCAFLRPGQSFIGGQRVAHHHGAPKQEETWGVKAVIQRYDHASGYVAGTMEGGYLLH